MSTAKLATFLAAALIAAATYDPGTSAQRTDPAMVRRAHVCMPRLGLDDLTLGADMIIRGRVIEQECTNTFGSIITTAVTFEPLDTYKGQAGEVVTAHVLGGETSDEALIVSAAPKFEIGDEAIVFLAAPSGTGEFGILGLSQGVFRTNGGTESLSSQEQLAAFESNLRRVVSLQSNGGGR